MTGFFGRATRKILRGLLRYEVSLELGSARKHHGLQAHIRSETPAGKTRYSVQVDPITRRETVVHHPEPVIYQLKDVVFTPWSGHLGYEGHRITESVKFDDRRAMSWDSSRFPRKTIPFSEPVTAMKLSRNYFHFLLEDLPRLILLRERARVRTVCTDDMLYPQFVEETMSLLGISKFKMKWPRGLAEVAFVAPLGEVFAPSPFAGELVRDAFPARQLVPDGPKLIYVSRRFSSRSIPNEDRVESWLSARGFEVVFLENMSFQDGVDLFSRASCVVAPHGAGLSNAVFMSDGSTVIEILFDYYCYPVFQGLLTPRLRYQSVIISESDFSTDMLLRELEEALQP